MMSRFFAAAACAAFIGHTQNARPQTPDADPLPAPVPLPSQAPLPQTLTPLTIETIMRGPEFWGTKPTAVTWALDSSRVYFRWKEPSAPLRAPLSWYVAARDKTAPPRKLSEAEAENEVPRYENGAITRDGKRAVWVQNGDLWLEEVGEKRQRITQTASIGENTPRFTRDEKRVTFLQGGNLFVIPLPPFARSASDLPILQQITNIVPASGDRNADGKGETNNAGSSGKTNKNADAQQARQRELFGILRDRAEGEAETKKSREAEAARKIGPKPWTLEANQTVVDLQLAPDETQIVAQISERGKTPAPQTSVVPEWINDAGRVSAQNGRAMVGQAASRGASLVLINTATGAVLPITPPDALKNKPMRFTNAQWSDTNENLVVSARTNDNHDFYLFAVDRATGKTTLLHDAHDAAWVGGPSAFEWGWMPSGKVWIVSETGGWAHLAQVSPSGEETALTSGPFEVFSPQLNRAKTAWYFTSSENNLGERHFWTMPAGDKLATRKQITVQNGIEDTNLSPDEKTLAVVASYVNRPPELFLQENKPGATPRRVTVSPSPLFSTYPWRDVPTVTFPARDGAPVSARLFAPVGEKEMGRGPAVVFVHGAGYLQNAHRGWSQYEHEFLFHHFLSDSGYTVLDIDYRGSAGYGRNVRTAIYKHMGSTDLTDAEDGAKWLIQTQNVDAHRIGIYGGSYGGFLTLMGLFTQPDTWACGAALRPVTDWSQYNEPYTANILGLPQDDYAPYRASSPIYYAQNFQGGLLICHGMEDSNVFFADTVRLTQRLIELGKTQWSVAMYPVENHSFSEAASWTDEFKRIFGLFETYLKPSQGQNNSAPDAARSPAFSTP